MNRMRAGRTFFEYFILLFQVFCFFFLSLFGEHLCVTNPLSPEGSQEGNS